MCDVSIEQENEPDNSIETNKYLFEVMNKFQILQMCYPLAGFSFRFLFIQERLKNIRFDKKMYVSEDLNFSCRYITKCENSIIFIKNKLYKYMQRKNSVTAINESKSKRLKLHMDNIEAVKATKVMIIENCKDMNIITMIERNTLSAYWTNIYLILNERLVKDNKLIKKYYNELKEYRQYYSLKDKFYMILLGISPKVFEMGYRNIKKLKKG